MLFTNYAIANNQVVTQAFSRLVTRPDVLFTAADLVSPPESGPTIIVIRRTNPRFQTNGVSGDLAGPGTIGPSFQITYNKVGPIKINYGNQFMDERTSVDGFLWGSFDGTTNAPVIYPNGTDIANLESQVLLSIIPPALTLLQSAPPATTNLTAIGGVPYYQPPFRLSLAPGSPPLPAGLTLSTNGVITVGTLTTTGSFTNTLRITDALERTEDRDYIITIKP
jgi:hypothetical protein